MSNVNVWAREREKTTDVQNRVLVWDFDATEPKFVVDSPSFGCSLEDFLLLLLLQLLLICASRLASICLILFSKHPNAHIWLFTLSAQPLAKQNPEFFMRFPYLARHIVVDRIAMHWRLYRIHAHSNGELFTENLNVVHTLSPVHGR